MSTCSHDSRFCLVAMLSLWTGGGSAADEPFTHPGILHSQPELEFVRKKVVEGETLTCELFNGEAKAVRTVTFRKAGPTPSD